MSPNPTYPGVYIEEIPSGVRTITGVATSVAAFIGYFRRGSMNQATQIFSPGDFEREFGGLDTKSEASYAIRQFFLNGGTEAWVVRVARDDPPESELRIAAVALKSDASDGGASVLQIAASSEGTWGNNLRLDVDYGTGNSSTFNLIVSEVASEGDSTRVVNSEVFRNLTLEADQSNSVSEVVNDSSKLIQIVGDPTPGQRPAQTGTTSNAFDASPEQLRERLSRIGASEEAPPEGETPEENTSLDFLIRVGLNPSIGEDGNFTALDADNSNEFTITISRPVSALQLANRLQAQLRRLPALGKATVVPLQSEGSMRILQIKSGTASPADRLLFSGDFAEDFALNQPTQINVQQYVLGAETQVGAQAFPADDASLGGDGLPPGANELIGGNEGEGLRALDAVDIFNLLCIPDTARLADIAAAQVIAQATVYCEERRAFYIVDVPQTPATARDERDEIRTWLTENDTLRHKNLALYFPRPKVADPLKEFRLRPVAISGTLAGVYARTDSERGVWKAPAGTEATLRGVQAFEYKLTDAENGVLNELGINGLRTFPIYGNVVWGARTLEGAEQIGSEWKYIPVRRVALFLEESLYRGLQWVVFEPNDEPLWSQIRLNVGAFMNNLFRQGAFQGKTPREAYFVKCDKETTTQNDIDQGIVNIVVGFAPLKPAEFVVIKFQQIAGQLAV